MTGKRKTKKVMKSFRTALNSLKNLTTLLLLIGIAMVGCKKEELKTSNRDGKSAIYQVEGVSVCLKTQKDISDISNYAWINFASVDSYIEALDSLNSWGDSCFAIFEENLNFYSMRQNLTEDEREALGVDDDLLATILNPDGVVQIGQYIFKLDFTTSQVEVFDTLTEVSEGTYNFDEEVLDILYEEGDANNNMQIEQRDNILRAANQYNGSCDVNLKIVYQRAAIYFSLLVKISKPLLVVSYPAVEIFYDSYDGSYRKNRTNASLQYITDKSDGGPKNSYTYRPYSAMCGLKYIRWTSEFFIIDYNNNTTRTYILSIRKS